jgi:flagellar export protein FliJ
MKPFVFRLQALEALRKAARDTCQAQLATAVAEQAKLAESRRATASQLLESQLLNRAARCAAVLSIETLVRGQQFETSLQNELKARLRLEAMAEIAAAEAADALLIAEREVEVLEKLRERQLAEHRLQQSRLETSRLDEVAAVRFQREAA